MAYRPIGHQSPKPRTVSFISDSKPSLPTPTELPTMYDFGEHTSRSKPLDLDGMNIMSNIPATSTLNLSLDLTEQTKEVQKSQIDPRDWGNDPVTATWGILMREVHSSPPPPTTPLLKHSVLWRQPALSLSNNLPHRRHQHPFLIFHHHVPALEGF